MARSNKLSRRQFLTSTSAAILAARFAPINSAFADEPEKWTEEYQVTDNSNLEFVKGSMTIAMLADTQIYVTNDDNNKVFKSMTTWIRDNAKARNIKTAVLAGDIVNNNSDPNMWDRARQSMSILNDKVPYVLAVGNHDLGTNGSADSRSTLFNEYFKIKDNKYNRNACKGFYQKNAMENACYTFEDKTGKFLILSLEFGPRDGVVKWANQIVKRYPDHKTILLTHEFLNELSRKQTGTTLRTLPETPGSPWKYQVSKLTGAVNCGQQLWDKLVSKHKNFYMTLNGHYADCSSDGISTGHRSDKTKHGNTVNQILFDSQWIKNGGDGWIRLIEIRPDNTIANRTYSPWLKKYRTGKEFEFILNSTV